MKSCTTKELAELIGISERAVRQCAERGVVVKDKEHGRFKMPDSVHAYISSLRMEKRGKAATYDAAKLQEKQAKARLAELQADEREGKMIPLDTIAAANGAILTAFTARLANFGDGLSSICHNQPGDFVSNRINEGLCSMLKELAKLPYLPEDK